MPSPLPGFFICGSDTDVGKTYVAALIAADLVRHGLRVGVYKPVASGCRIQDGTLVSDDAIILWQAAGCPGELARVAPQRFAAAVAPPVAARQAGQTVDATLLRTGLDYWRERSDVLLVEGAGGWLSPLTDLESNAELARDLRLPLVVVARNGLGTLNQTLATLLAIKTLCPDLPVAGVVLNGAQPPDASTSTNRRELAARCQVSILAEIPHQAQRVEPPVLWLTLATGGNKER